MKIQHVSLSFIPVTTRVPLKFGSQTLTQVTLARVAIEASEGSQTATGFSETPLSVPWVWPAELDYHHREDRLKNFCQAIQQDLAACALEGHPLMIGHQFLENHLTNLLTHENSTHPPAHHLPQLAALVCLSAFDLALYDAFGKLHDRPAFECLDQAFLGPHDLSHFLEPADRFVGKFPAHYLVPPEKKLPVWHLVGGLDPLKSADLTGTEPHDGYPLLLRDWIRRDGLFCLKIKLRGNDSEWDRQRLIEVGEIALAEGVTDLSTDFNCTVTDPAYVNQILDDLAQTHPEIHRRILYVEQPFPYDLEAHQIEVHSLSRRKPLFMDESAHDWRFVRLGHQLGWTGVALKTCKTLTGALLSLCWAREHGMDLMVQDLTNPRLAQIPHVLLASYAGTIRGVESNAMQFYPEASLDFLKIHPGLYQRRKGFLNLDTLHGPGFGYAGAENLP